MPPTKTHVGTYSIHRVHFLRAKSIIARLNCTCIINISSRRLFVKTPGITIENLTFEEDPRPDDPAVKLYLKHAGKKAARKGKHNILVIDESGSDYAAILAGWHLISQRKVPAANAIESVTARIGFLDPWYTDLLTSWAAEK